MKAMVVEDGTVHRKFIKQYLERRSDIDSVLEAIDGADGLQKANENPDLGLIVTDIHMPNMDGLELISQLKQGAATKNIKIIIMTTDSEKTTVVKAIQLGVNKFIIKPVQEDALNQAIDKTFNG